MKITKFSLFIAFAAFMFGCQKGEIPGNDQKYIGTWKNVDGTFDDSYSLVINDNAKASYEENHTHGAGYSTKSVSGYIYFTDDYNFRVGSKHVGKKFKVDMAPKRVTITVTPYTYYYVATFNGVDYKKQ